MSMSNCCSRPYEQRPSWVKWLRGARSQRLATQSVLLEGAILWTIMTYVPFPIMEFWVTSRDREMNIFTSLVFQGIPTNHNASNLQDAVSMSFLYTICTVSVPLPYPITFYHMPTVQLTECIADINRTDRFFQPTTTETATVDRISSSSMILLTAGMSFLGGFVSSQTQRAAKFISLR
jgi:hypothetical protein